jgi:hypothetical protein
MALIVVGGQSRSVGKTSVVAGLIAALQQYQWSAFKISQHRHGPAAADQAWAIDEEKDASGDSDTSRFLAAGAARAWLVRVEAGKLAEAVPMIRQRLAEPRHAIVESNSIMDFLRPDLYLTVIDPSAGDFKASAQEFLVLADAVILQRPTADKELLHSWMGIPLESLERRPVFSIEPPRYVTAEIVDFVEGKLRSLNISAP